MPENNEKDQMASAAGLGIVGTLVLHSQFILISLLVLGAVVLRMMSGRW